MSSVIAKVESIGLYELGSWSKMEQEFSRVYAACFSEEPYLEQYEEEWVTEHIYSKHVDCGCVLVALKNAQLVGLACAKPMRMYTESSPYRYLSGYASLPFELDRSLYMTELAVLPEVRRRGIGTALVTLMQSWGKVHQYEAAVVRTAHEGSKSIGIFRRLGADTLPGFQCIADETDEVPSHSTQRVYLWNKL
jgi:ribosomal protein S18 acetylase RimI-like enzyme